MAWTSRGATAQELSWSPPVGRVQHYDVRVSATRASHIDVSFLTGRKTERKTTLESDTRLRVRHEWTSATTLEVRVMYFVADLETVMGKLRLDSRNVERAPAVVRDLLADLLPLHGARVLLELDARGRIASATGHEGVLAQLGIDSENGSLRRPSFPFLWTPLPPPSRAPQTRWTERVPLPGSTGDPPVSLVVANTLVDTAADTTSGARTIASQYSTEGVGRSPWALSGNATYRVDPKQGVLVSGSQRLRVTHRVPRRPERRAHVIIAIEVDTQTVWTAVDP